MNHWHDYDDADRAAERDAIERDKWDARVNERHEPRYTSPIHRYYRWRALAMRNARKAKASFESDLRIRGYIIDAKHWHREIMAAHREAKMRIPQLTRRQAS